MNICTPAPVPWTRDHPSRHVL